MPRVIAVSSALLLVMAACGAGAETDTTEASSSALPAGWEIDLPPGFDGEMTITQGTVAADVFAEETEVLAVFEVGIDGELGGEATITYQTDLVVGDDGFIPDLWILTSDDGEVWRLTMDRSIVVADDGTVTVSGVVDAFSTVVAVKGARGWNFVPRTVTASVGESFTASISAMRLVPRIGSFGGGQGIAIGVVVFVGFEASSGSAATATYRCINDGVAIFGVEKVRVIEADTDTDSEEYLKARLYFLGAPAAALSVQDEINEISWREDRLVPTLSVTGDATCVKPLDTEPGASIPVDVLDLLEAGELDDQGVFNPTELPLPPVDIASLTIEAPDSSSLIFNVMAVAPGSSQFGGMFVFADIADGGFFEFGFDFFEDENGTPTKLALGGLLGADGTFTQLAPPPGAIDGGFSVTVPLVVEGDSLFVLPTPIDGSELPERIEVFRDDALATYDIRLEEFLAALTP